MAKSLRKSKHIETEQTLKIKDIEQKMSRYRSQHDESMPGARAYSDEESGLLITGKLQERINIQKKVREAFIVSVYQYSELEDMKYILDEYNGLSIDNKPKWFGVPYSKKMWNNEYALKIHKFKDTIQAMKYHEDALVNVGFNIDQINLIKNDGEYITDLKLLEQMEKDRDLNKFKGPEVIDGTKGNGD